MATELIITSVPKGLKPGSYGFCTAACTKDLNEPTSRALEVISGYRHIFSSEEGKANPVAFSYILYEIVGRQRRVLSRVADMGTDYSGRTNKIAHHLVLSEEEAKRPAGPAALCASGVFMERWPEDEQPHYLDARTVSCSESINVNAIKTGAWQKLTGDPGWAGVLAGTVLTRRPVILIVRPDQDVLTLFREALVLLKPEERWKATFSTYYTSLPANAQCQWRALVDGAYDEKLLRIPNAITLDLRNPSALPRVDEIALTPQEKPLVDLARGAASASAEAPQSWEPLGLTPEEAPKSRAPGRGPNPFNRKDDVFFGSVDNGDNSTLGEGYKPDGSTGVSYMPPSHKKSGMIWVLIGFLAGLVILAIVALAFWFTVGNKKDGYSGAPPAGPATQKQDSPDGKGPESAKDTPADSSRNAKKRESPSSEHLTGKKHEEGQASENKPESPELQDTEADKGDSSQKEEPNEAENGEADNPPNAESEQHTAKPIVVELEEQWNKLKDGKDFGEIVHFIAQWQNDVEDLNSKISNCTTFLNEYNKHDKGKIDDITPLCSKIEKVKEDAKSIADNFDIELFRRKCEIVSEGVDYIITLYEAECSDEKKEHFSSSIEGLNGALTHEFSFEEETFYHTPSEDDSDKIRKNIAKLRDGLKPIKDKSDDYFNRSKTEEFGKELKDINDHASKFEGMRLELEEEVLYFIVRTINSNDSFAAFTKDPREDTSQFVTDKGKQKFPVWGNIGKNKKDELGRALEAYVKYCRNSQEKWACSLTFKFNKTNDINAQEKKIKFLPSENSNENNSGSFDVEINGEQVSLFVKMATTENKEGGFIFCVSDTKRIPEILRSARVRLSFICTTDPGKESINSNFCQLQKTIDMTKTADIQTDDFLTTCEYITEADFEKIERDSKKPETKDGENLSSDKAVCVVVCDKEKKENKKDEENGEKTDGEEKDKKEDPLKGVSLKSHLEDTSEGNSDEETETRVGKRIFLVFSRTVEGSSGSVKYKRGYAHRLYNSEKKFSSNYEGDWSLEDEKATSSASQDYFIDEELKNKTLELWDKEYGTGNLLFYLVYPGYGVGRENWILYGKAPYRVSE